MKKVLIGIICILIAVVGILDAVGMLVEFEGVFGALSFMQILGGLIIFALAIMAIVKLRVFSSVMLLSFLFMIFEGNIAFLCHLNDSNIINNWLLLLLSAVFGIGLSLLLPKRKRGFSLFCVNGKGKHGGHRFASNTVYIDCASFREQSVENNLSSTTVQFENADRYGGGSLLHIENNLGSTVILLPQDWKLDCQIENNLGSIKNELKTGGNGPSVTITGENNLGTVVIRHP